MRRMSEKARRRYEAVKPVRDELRRTVRRCECCRRPRSQVFGQEFDVHEILGAGLRQKTLDERCSLLVICRKCHDGPVFGGLSCASERAAYQLSLLYRSRPGDYDLVRFNWLRNPSAPRFVEQTQVDSYLEGTKWNLG